MAVAAPVPKSLTSLSETTAPVAGETSTTAATSSQPPSSPVTTPTHPAPVVKQVVRPIVPNHLFIPAIGVNTITFPKGTVWQYDQFTGRDEPSFGVPPETAEGLLQTTWWSDGPKPGSRGMAIVLGHSDVGIFDNLGKLKAGQVAGLSDGHTLLKFRVIGKPRTGIPKTDPAALQRALQHHPANARLALLTCSGQFNGSESEENTVVFLEFVSAERIGK